MINHVQLGRGEEALAFLRSLGVGTVGGIGGTVILWLLLSKARLRGVLATEAIVATVIGVAALCDASRDDTGLIAAIVMGVALANLRQIDLPEDRRFFKTVVQLVTGFCSYRSRPPWPPPDSSRYSPRRSCSLSGSCSRSGHSWRRAPPFAPTSQRVERAFIGWMGPRGIVAASTAATFGPPLVAAKIVGAEKLLPVTFLVIVCTVALYGLSGVPVSRMLGLHETRAEQDTESDLPDEPDAAPPLGDL